MTLRAGSPHLVVWLGRDAPPHAVVADGVERASGSSCADSTDLAVCHNVHIGQHRVFAGRARRGKTSVDWFFDVTWHLVVNDRDDLLAFCLTPGNVDDRRPLPTLLRRVRRVFGERFADRGSLSRPLTVRLFVAHGVHLITRLRRTMHNRQLDVSDTLLLRKRAIIETNYDQLKSICQIEHSRHRSPVNFLVNLVAGLAAYCRQPKQPALDLDPYRFSPL
ncbi:MAG: hypothetical protein PVSMB4_05020 [Ktedonobacterales bacterium]